MPTSRNNKTHKERINNRKQKIEQIKQSMSQQQAQQLPEVRNIPTWDPNANIIVKGYEWEAIFNALTTLQTAAQAASSVMSQNLLSGVIKMDFQKLDPATLQYVEMEQAEKEQYNKNFEEAVKKVKEQQEKEQQAATKTEPETESTIDEGAKIITLSDNV